MIKVPRGSSATNVATKRGTVCWRRTGGNRHCSSTASTGAPGVEVYHRLSVSIRTMNRYIVMISSGPNGVLRPFILFQWIYGIMIDPTSPPSWTSWVFYRDLPISMPHRAKHPKPRHQCPKRRPWAATFPATRSKPQRKNWTGWIHS